MVTKNAFICCLTLLLLIQTATALTDSQQTDNSITYTIVAGSTIVEHHFSYAKAQFNLSIILPNDAEAIEFSGAPFKLTDQDDYKILKISKVKNATLKYISDGFVEKTKDRYFTSNLADIEGSRDITVILPESASLKYAIDSAKTALVPSTDDIRSDGKRIIIHWSEEDLEKANSLLVIYNEKSSKNVVLILASVAALLAIALVLLYIFYSRIRSKNKVHRHKDSVRTKKVRESSEQNLLTRNLFEEEKAIVETLDKAKDKELWQKDILFETGISKVRLSRKLRSLEYKGIIEKVPYGNTNKIRLK